MFCVIMPSSQWQQEESNSDECSDSSYPDREELETDEAAMIWEEHSRLRRKLLAKAPRYTRVVREWNVILDIVKRWNSVVRVYWI